MGEDSILVADQAVLSDLIGVEVDLDLHVLGDRLQHRAGFLDQHLAGLELAVDVGVVAVPLVGELLHHVVVEVARTDTEHGQEHPGLAFGFDERHQRRVVVGAHVEVAVARDHDPVDAVFDEGLLGEVVGEVNARRTVGAASRLEPLQRVDDGAVVGPGRGRQHCPRRARVDDERDPVAHVHLLGERHQSLLDEPESIWARHRPRHIDEEHQVAWRNVACLHVPALDPHVHDPVRGVPRRGANFGGDRERRVAAGLGVVVVEVVDHLLGPHRIGRRHDAALAQEAANVGVGGRVDVDGERRLGVVERLDEGVEPCLPVAFVLPHRTVTGFGVATPNVRVVVPDRKRAAVG